jgi:BirA family biotin operon repressor/biotin-[acetyl-CoA-carboxylase] ligase
VLEALRAAGPLGISGEVLAGELGVSRTAVSKHVAALRAAGYSIQARAGEGYRLLGVPDLPIPAEVGALLTDPFWADLEGGKETGSTNDDARTLARRGAAEGTVVVAAQQSSGRGRLGRSWESPRGGVYLSAILRPALAPAEVPSLALAVALGVCYGLEALGVSPRLKWPNDVLLDGGKVAGVLLEMAAEADRVEWVVAGIGLNVRATDVPRAGAAYLGDSLPGASAPASAAALLDGIAKAYREWLAGGFSALQGAYEQRHALTGSDVTVSELDGTVRASGRVTGVDTRGRLVVERAGSTVTVSAGEVTLREPVSRG